MPYIFTIQNNPNEGDIVSLSMTDGNGLQANYNYTVQVGDTLQSVSDSIKALVNAGVLFTAIDQTTVPGEIGLQVSQVATNSYELFAGSLTITLNPALVSPAYTMVFDEVNNAFEGERSYHPENWGCLGTLLISFINGTLWTHDNPVYNNWYGVQYESTITTLFNENPFQKKAWISVAEVCNKTWDCPEIESSLDSIEPLGIKQQSNLILPDFAILEGMPTASFLGDSLSQGGIIEGDRMRGFYLKVKFRSQVSQTTTYTYLGLVQVKFIDSPLNLVN